MQRNIILCAIKVCYVMCNHTGPPCSVGRTTSHAPGCRPAAHRQHHKRQTTTTDVSVQNNTGSLGGPVTNCSFHEVNVSHITYVTDEIANKKSIGENGRQNRSQRATNHLSSVLTAAVYGA